MKALAPALAFFVALAGASPIAAQTPSRRVLERYNEIGPALIACWRPPEGTEGMEITLVFSFRKNGEILGKPRISFTRLHGDADLQKRFVASALAALAACTPLNLSEGLGAAVAGRPFAMLYRARARQQGV